jgi:pimeloyl-ACP methyl ester carboxylesterase
VDLPGHGRSPGPLRHTVAGLADWVAGLLDAAQLPQAALVGHSMGSLVALETAIRVSHRVSRLALLGTSAPMAVGEPFMAAAADADPASLDMEAVWGHARQVSLAQSPVPGTSLLGSSRALNGRARPGVLHADLQACAGFAPKTADIAALPMPVLVMAGRRDQMTPHKAGRAVADLVPGARFVLLDAGHAMMSEAPREVLHHLEAFLR